MTAFLSESLVRACPQTTTTAQCAAAGYLWKQSLPFQKGAVVHSQATVFLAARERHALRTREASLPSKLPPIIPGPLKRHN
jgi:hypothetical protein